MKYIKYSDLNDINNPDLAKILDYIERHSYNPIRRNDLKTEFHIGNLRINIMYPILYDIETHIFYNNIKVMNLPLRYFSDNIVGLFGNLRKLGKI